MKKIFVSQIDWDLDGVDETEAPDLPNEVEMEVEDDLDVSGYSEEIADTLSDTFGWLTRGFAVDVANA